MHTRAHVRLRVCMCFDKGKAAQTLLCQSVGGCSHCVHALQLCIMTALRGFTRWRGRSCMDILLLAGLLRPLADCCAERESAGGTRASSTSISSVHGSGPASSEGGTLLSTSECVGTLASAYTQASHYAAAQ